ncbi:ArsR/SmtB family transcription factor [Desemzia sp. FAM 24101]|uniref:ArsR/SmtB family transcription factor n=1 Tax=unclassified Desemzia TaxID=2685243 RepID=UPI0038878BBC
MGIEVCKTNILHKEKVENVKSILDEKDFSSLLALGRCFGDISRIKIFYALETYKEMCVCDLAAILDASIATTSHHLRFLKKHGMAISRQDGKMVYYSIVNEEVHSIIRAFFNVPENKIMKS